MRINQKGMTSIELLITFVILSLVVTGMFDVVLNYKDREIIESIRATVVEYDNSLQKLIQDDFIKGHLQNVTINTTNPNLLTATFQMEKDEPPATTYVTTLQIDITNGIISYGRSGEVVKYPIPKFDTSYGSNSTISLALDKDKTFIETIGDTNKFVNITITYIHQNFKDGELTFSITSPLIKFMDGEPMNPATKRFTG